MGNSVNKFRKALQQGNELLACQLYVQNPDIRERLDPNSPNKDSQHCNTPLHYAAKYGMKSLLRDFLIRGGNPNKQNSLDQTALHMLMITTSGTMPAVDQKRLDCLHMLLKWRGKAAIDGVGERLNLNATDHEKKTALHFAAFSGLSLCVQGLVGHGASLFLEDDQNFTACDIAELNKQDAVAAFLEAKMVFNDMEEEAADIEDVDLQPLYDEEYSGLCAQDLQEIKDQLIVETADMLQVPLFTAEALLRNHEWSREMLLESWMDNPLSACEKAGVKLAQDHVALDLLKNKLNGARKRTNLSSSDPVTEHKCDICDEVLPADNSIIEIPCGHMFCNSCWERYLSTKIKDGDTQNILCPGHDCSKLVPVEITEKLVSRDMARRYLQFDIKAFVDTNPNLRWCPHPGCGRAVKLPEMPTSLPRHSTSANAKAKAVDCGDGHYFCWVCIGEAHEPCTCETWEKWLKIVDEINPNEVREQAEDRESVANAYWLISNSKKCPNCRSHIQKNEGCNHMTCSKCKHDFCWVCLEHWKLHSAETGGYFRCNRYEVANAVEESFEREFKKLEKEHDEVQQINRFMHYYTRCKNHENSFQMEKKLLDAVQEKVAGLQKAAVELDVYVDFDATFIEESIKELLKSRLILKGSYPFGYFLENDRGQRTIFESMQDEVEQATETLSGMVARPFLKTPRKKIINATRKLRRRKKEFLSAIYRGLIPDDDFEYDFTPTRSFQSHVQSRIIHHREPEFEDNGETSSQGRARSAHSRVWEMLNSDSGRTPEQMERNLLEWLELIGLDLRETSPGESNNGRRNAVSKLRRRIEETYRKRGSSKKNKRRSKDESSVQHVENGAAGASAAGRTDDQPYQRLRPRVVLFAEESSSSDASDPPAVVLDDSDVDSDDDDDVQNAGGASLAAGRKKTVIAQFDYVACSQMEISLEAGDVIEVIEKRVDGWWRGRCQGKEGLFPSHFVVELDPDGGTSLEASRNRALTGNSSTENADEILQRALALSLAEYESNTPHASLQGDVDDLISTCNTQIAVENTGLTVAPEHEE